MKRTLIVLLVLTLVVGASFCSELDAPDGVYVADASVVGVPDAASSVALDAVVGTVSDTAASTVPGSVAGAASGIVADSAHSAMPSAALQEASGDGGACSNNLGLALDCAVVQDLIFSKGSFQLTGDFRVFAFDGFELRLPFGFSYAFGSSCDSSGVSSGSSSSGAGGSTSGGGGAGGSRSGGSGVFMFEFGALLVYYPWDKGPFMGLSLFQVGVTDGRGLLENLVNLNEVMFGWTFELGHGLFVEPALCIRDPSGTFSDEYSRIKGVFACYGTFRFRLSFGWRFLEV